MEKSRAFLTLSFCAFFSLIFLFAACKREEDKTKKEQQHITANGTVAPSDYLIVKKENLPLLWKDRNENYIITEGNDVFEVDATKIAGEDLPSWLRKNGKYIDFDRSANYILKAHKLENPVTSVGTMIKKNYDDIRAIIGERAFETDTYDNYIFVNFNPVNNSFAGDYKDEFNSLVYCHSIPFFRSLYKKFGDQVEFEFGYDGTSTRFIHIIDGTTHYYYDISSDPTLISKYLNL